MEMLATLEALRIFSRLFQEKLTVESDSSNSLLGILFEWHPLEILLLHYRDKSFNCFFARDFRHVGRTANALADVLAKQGASTIVPLCALIL